jgi:hypothetical protein
MLRPSIVFFTALGLLASVAANAETFRCGQRIASPEVSVEQVDVYGHSANGGRIKTGTSVVETLTFDRGNTAAAMVVIVVDGKIKSMEREK